jgi:soluble lytic murein transglycosylase
MVIRIRLLKGAESLWLSGSSVSSACDNLFEAWQKAGLRTDDKVLDRMVLAYEARKRRMLTYLKKLPESKKSQSRSRENCQTLSCSTRDRTLC